MLFESITNFLYKSIKTSLSALKAILNLLVLPSFSMRIDSLKSNDTSTRASFDSNSIFTLKIPEVSSFSFWYLLLLALNRSQKFIYRFSCWLLTIKHWLGLQVSFYWCLLQRISSKIIVPVAKVVYIKLQCNICL